MLTLIFVNNLQLPIILSRFCRQSILICKVWSKYNVLAISFYDQKINTVVNYRNIHNTMKLANNPETTSINHKTVESLQFEGLMFLNVGHEHSILLLCLQLFGINI